MTENKGSYRLKQALLFFAIFMLWQQSTAQKAFQKKVFYASETDSLLYNILLADNFDTNKDSTKKYPLILFLHGAGERGNDNEKHIIHIKELFLDSENRKNYNAFVIAPQCPNEKKWVEVDWSLKKHDMPELPSEPMRLTMDLIDSLIASYPIDTNKIYITGLSMGGFGTWDAIARYPNKFAAAIPICGGGDEKTAKTIKDIPIWAFHGSADHVVMTDRTRNMINAIRAVGGKPLYTEYKGIGHGSWFKTYKEPTLLEWLFAQSKNK